MSKKKPVTYLCGPMQDTTDGGTRWREQLTPKLEKLGIEVLDPTKIEAEEYGSVDKAHTEIQNYVSSGNWEKWDEVVEDIVQRDVDAVYASDFIIGYYDVNVKMGGTLCEMWEAAYHRKIPVYVVSRNAKRDWNIWMLRTIRKTGQVFDSWTQLVEFLEKTHGKKAKKKDESIVARVGTALDKMLSTSN